MPPLLCVQNDVTPFTASTAEKTFDYMKLIVQFGSQAIDEALLKRMERLTGKPVHPWLRRGMFFSHRDFNLILDFVRDCLPYCRCRCRIRRRAHCRMGAVCTVREENSVLFIYRSRPVIGFAPYGSFDSFYVYEMAAGYVQRSAGNARCRWIKNV